VLTSENEYLQCLRFECFTQGEFQKISDIVFCVLSKGLKTRKRNMYNIFTNSIWWFGYAAFHLRKSINWRMRVNVSRSVTGDRHCSLCRLSDIVRRGKLRGLRYSVHVPYAGKTVNQHGIFFSKT
jgi:hypothetical protein